MEMEATFVSSSPIDDIPLYPPFTPVEALQWGLTIRSLNLTFVGVFGNACVLSIDDRWEAPLTPTHTYLLTFSLVC